MTGDTCAAHKDLEELVKETNESVIRQEVHSKNLLREFTEIKKDLKGLPNLIKESFIEHKEGCLASQAADAVAKDATMRGIRRDKNSVPPAKVEYNGKRSFTIPMWVIWIGVIIGVAVTAAVISAAVFLKQVPMEKLLPRSATSALVK